MNTEFIVARDRTRVCGGSGDAVTFLSCSRNLKGGRGGGATSGTLCLTSVLAVSIVRGEIDLTVRTWLISITITTIFQKSHACSKYRMQRTQMFRFAISRAAERTFSMSTSPSSLRIRTQHRRHHSPSPHRESSSLLLMAMSFTTATSSCDWMQNSPSGIDCASKSIPSLSFFTPTLQAFSQWFQRHQGRLV